MRNIASQSDSPASYPRRIAKTSTEGVDQEWYADDSAGVGTVKGACAWLDALVKEGKGFGYSVNASKTVALVKRSAVDAFRKELAEMVPEIAALIQVVVLEDLEAEGAAEGESGDVKEWGRRYLGAGMGGPRFREMYVGLRVDEWTEGLLFLAKVAAIDPQVGYSILVDDMVPRWRYLMRTTPSEPKWFDKLEAAIIGPIFGALFGCEATDEQRARIALPLRHAGLAIPDPRKMAGEEHAASLKVTKAFVDLLDAGKRVPGWRELVQGKQAGRDVRIQRDHENQLVQDDLYRELAGRQKKGFEESIGRGRSNVLSVAPTGVAGTGMPALWWRVNMKLRLGMDVTADMPSKCPDCGIQNSVDHALGGGATGACGGARNRRHDEVVGFVNRLCRDAGFHIPGSDSYEPVVGKLDPKDPDTRCDGIVRGLKTPQRDTWYDVVVPDTGAISHAMDESAVQTLEKAEDKKLEKHGQRVALAENADFVPIACSVYGTTGFHCALRRWSSASPQSRLGSSRR